MLRRIASAVPPRSISQQARLLHTRPRFIVTPVQKSNPILNRRLLPTPLNPRIRTTFLGLSHQPASFASFHSTPRNQGGPLIPIFLGLLKASTGFELARTASRVALTFFPLLWLKNKFSRKYLRHFAAIHGTAVPEAQKADTLYKIRMRTKILQILLFIPFVLFWATIIASLERTPLTGRWRMILLSPDEEDEIANQLAGPGWFNSVGEILIGEGSPRIIPPTDWRYQWVYDTLRRLEASLPVLAREPELCPNWTEVGPEDNPLPPPADYPLRPRPRASEYLHWFCHKMTRGQDISGPLGNIPGPPYSLLVIDKPDSSNAFSYGFGADGGSGIVVYSGFLDDIFSKLPMEQPQPRASEQASFLTRLLGGLFSSSPPAPHPIPSADQTTELAILLAHEMAHLILSHHLESLSSMNVIVPGTLSIAADLIRVLIFPITALFGPFVNDAVAHLGKVGSGELAKISEYCTNAKQEIEADVVSARILAHAGFDARDAIRFWENRCGEEAECARHGKHDSLDPPMKYARAIMGTSHHPISDVRVTSLRQELERWEAERRKALPQSSKS